MLEVAIVAAALGALVVYVAPTLDRPLLEKHAFRQTQTAYTARIFHEEGIDLLHPKLPVLGEPYEAPLELPLYQAVASVVMDAGVADDTALRATCLAFFLLTALLLFGLVRHVAGRVAALVAVVTFTLSPFALVWSRTSMIEYLATAGAVGFCWATIRWRESRRPLPYALALAAGLVALLVKPTTGIFWLAPAFAYRTSATSAPRSRRTDLAAAALVAVPLLATVAWTRHADAIKAASPTTEWLTSSALRDWNLGTLASRFDPDTWEVIGGRVPLVIGLGLLLLPLAVLAAWRSTQRPFWAAIASAAVLPTLVFTPLYTAHDYYLAAVSPALAALVGLGASYFSRLPARPTVAVVACVATAVLVVLSLEFGRTYWLRIHGGDDDTSVLPLARELQHHTQPDERIAVYGLDWSPAVLYYAHRRGLMVPWVIAPVALDRIEEDGYRYLLAPDPEHVRSELRPRWPALRKVGPHLYVLED
jgi:hypothetical protein